MNRKGVVIAWREGGGDEGVSIWRKADKSADVASSCGEPMRETLILVDLRRRMEGEEVTEAVAERDRATADDATSGGCCLRAAVAASACKVTERINMDGVEAEVRNDGISRGVGLAVSKAGALAAAAMAAAVVAPAKGC